MSGNWNMQKLYVSKPCKTLAANRPNLSAVNVPDAHVRIIAQSWPHLVHEIVHANVPSASL